MKLRFLKLRFPPPRKLKAYALLIFGCVMITTVVDFFFALGIALYILGLRALFTEDHHG